MCRVEIPPVGGSVRERWGSLDSSHKNRKNSTPSTPKRPKLEHPGRGLFRNLVWVPKGDGSLSALRIGTGFLISLVDVSLILSAFSSS